MMMIMMKKVRMMMMSFAPWSFYLPRPCHTHNHTDACLRLTPNTSNSNGDTLNSSSNSNSISSSALKKNLCPLRWQPCLEVCQSTLGPCCRHRHRHRHRHPQHLRRQCHPRSKGKVAFETFAHTCCRHRRQCRGLHRPRPRHPHPRHHRHRTRALQAYQLLTLSLLLPPLLPRASPPLPRPLPTPPLLTSSLHRRSAAWSICTPWSSDTRLTTMSSQCTYCITMQALETIETM